jgi:uncharacterized protein (TIGR02118 family)
MQQCVTIVYPNTPGARFDFDYYVNKHVPMWVKFLGGGNKIEVRRGVATQDGRPVHFLCVVRIWVEGSIDDFMTRFKNDARPIISDIPKYTHIEPVIQFDQVLIA